MRRVVLILLLGCLAVAAAGCGGGQDSAAEPETVSGTPGSATEEGAPQGGGDAVVGKQVFLDNGCGDCHVLADAGTEGTIGPNLDEAKPELGIAIERVRDGKPPMPAFKDRLTEKQINDVAAYVVDATTE